MNRIKEFFSGHSRKPSGSFPDSHPLVEPEIKVITEIRIGPEEMERRKTRCKEYLQSPNNGDNYLDFHQFMQDLIYLSGGRIIESYNGNKKILRSQIDDDRHNRTIVLMQRVLAPSQHTPDATDSQINIYTRRQTEKIWVQSIRNPYNPNLLENSTLSIGLPAFRKSKTHPTGNEVKPSHKEIGPEEAKHYAKMVFGAYEQNQKAPAPQP